MPPIYGVSYRNMVMVDLDNMSFKRVKKLAFKTMKLFKLEGFIILKTSAKNYHVVFDKFIRKWEDVLQIIGSMAINSNNPEVWKWMCMQARKKHATLRVSPKPLNPNGFKPSPRIVYRYGSQNNMVKEFLIYRRRVLRNLKRLGVY